MRRLLVENAPQTEYERQDEVVFRLSRIRSPAGRAVQESLGLEQSPEDLLLVQVGVEVDDL